MESSAGTNARVGGDKNESIADQSSQIQQLSRQQRQDHDSSATINSSKTTYCAKLKELRQTGQVLRSDLCQPNLLQKPTWFDADLFENAKSVYGRHFMGINFAHLSGLLILVRVNSIYRTLSATGKSDSVAKLFNRYYQTVIHVKKWYEGDIFKEDSEAHRSLLIVRGMHNKVSTSLNKDGTTNTTTGQAGPGNNNNSSVSHEQVHISEYDIMLTQFAFIGFIVTRAKSVGLIEDFNQRDLESLVHFWRVIGYYLGASEEFNLCSRKLDELIGLCDAFMDLEYKQSTLVNPIESPNGIMSVNIVRSIKFVPLLTIYGMTKYLYELIGIDTSEFEARATRYSRLSYTLIKLVMTRLLAYKAFRWFNNGLARFSVWLVGQRKHSFMEHLETKYGQGLQPM